MNNISTEPPPRDGWRHILVMLAMVAVGFLAQTDPAAAQVQTYYYQEPYFDNPGCTSTPPTFNCVGGSVSASVTLDSVGSIASVAISANGLTPPSERAIFKPPHLKI